MGDGLLKLEQTPAIAANESLRLIIPRAIYVIYTLRNKRGIGHVGGDVDANEMDTSTMVKLADWVIVELIRIYHNLSIEEAQAIIYSINTKEIPDIWEINGKKRVLIPNLKYKDKTLLLAYNEIDAGIALEDLYAWTEHSNLSMFKRSVIQPLHSEGLIEYDKELDFIFLSPTGIAKVEKSILGK